VQLRTVTLRADCTYDVATPGRRERIARLIGMLTQEKLRVVLAAHGSADSRCPVVIDAIADSVRRRLPDAAVITGYLDHCQPRLSDVATAGDVVVPLLLSAGYHSAIDIPAAVPAGCVVTPPLGPDVRLAQACADRLREAGWSADDGPVVLAAAGSADPAARDDVAAVARRLASLLGVAVSAAYLSAAEPGLDTASVGAAAVATYLIAPGRFSDLAASYGVPVVSSVLGDHPALADIVANRVGALVRT
jgi:sirohydrochlorin ferrochelatase